jgi:hypothetical protein
MGAAQRSGAVPVDRSRRMLDALGLTQPVGKVCPCILHDRAHSGRTYRRAGGSCRFECSEDKRSRGLAEVRAELGYRRRVPLSGTQLARWRERLLFEADLLSPTRSLIELPEHSSESLRCVARGWQLLVGLRHERWEDDPFTFARSFVVAWCGVSDEQAKSGVRELERLGCMRRVGVLNRCILWAPPERWGPDEPLVPRDDQADITGGRR